jgi:hypothetical protein
MTSSSRNALFSDMMNGIRCIIATISDDMKMQTGQYSKRRVDGRLSSQYLKEAEVTQPRLKRGAARQNHIIGLSRVAQAWQGRNLGRLWL